MRWNSGGWFGAQLGGTCWMLIAGVLSAVRDLSTGAMILLLFAALNVVGWLLWRLRSLSCYASTQTLIGLIGASGIACVYLLQRGGLWQEIQSGPSVTHTSGYFIVAGVTLGLMAMFYFQFGRGNGSSKT